MQSTIIRSISFPVITFTLSVKSELYLQLRFDVKIKSFKTIVILHFHQQLGYKRVWSGVLWANSFLRPHNFIPLISSYSTFPLIILHLSAKNKRGRKTVFTTDQIPPAQGGFGQGLGSVVWRAGCVFLSRGFLLVISYKAEETCIRYGQNAATKCFMVNEAWNTDKIQEIIYRWGCSFSTCSHAVLSNWAQYSKWMWEHFVILNNNVFSVGGIRCCRDFYPTNCNNSLLNPLTCFILPL